ncbi:TonB-dependent siderophore receptor [Pseudoxanthomonas sp. z9]|uniref:TonB-dependent siderophore receptor n=1 Tax=Pseudoxanthomonas sp. z9 TaxID=2584942 RepID=UPI001144238B|nr:TonB-dependent siderophore receptor [Pseudoxanthomonas sp. z9]
MSPTPVPTLPFRHPLAQAIALACALLPGLARAQAASDGPTTLDAIEVHGEKENKNSYTIRETGSATKLNLSLRETPQSVTVITRQRLDDMGLFSLSGVMQQVTGVFVQYTDSERVNYNSRGYAISNIQVDGMLNTGGYVKADGDSAVYERIEVVRGATGLTTGAGDPSGTINLIRKRPTSEFAMTTGLTVGRWSNHRFETDISGPLGWNGRLRGRLVAAKQQSDSWRDFYTLDKNVLYGVIEADLTARTLLTAGYDYQSPETQGATWGTVPYWNADGSLARLPRRTNLSARWSSWPREDRQAFARLEQSFANGWLARLAYTRADSGTDGYMFYGGNGFPRADGSGITVWNSYFLGSTRSDALEFNASGPLRLFGREHTLLFGYSTLTQREYTPYTENVLPAGYASWDDYLRIPDWRTWDGNVPRFDSIRYGHDSYRSRVKQTAGFFAARLNFTDALKAVVGARYSSWETASEERYNPAGILEARNGYKVDDVLTPYAGMLYDINDTLTVYGSYTNIFKPQEYRDRNNRYLDPNEGDSYELGLKGEFFNGGLNASAAVFRSEQDNLAEIDDSVPPRIINGSPTYAYKSTGKGNKVEGWELEVQGQINEDWNIAGGFTHAKAENAAGVRINTMQPVDLFRLNTYYRLPGRWNRLSVGGGVTWQGKLTGTGNRPTGAYNPDGTPITQRAPLEQPSFHLLNLSASYRFSDNITASLNVNNLLDKAYYSRMGFYNGVHWGEPRNITLNLRIHL